ncbi:chryseobasin-related MNIO class RiPP peptide [Spirosoma endophyticum]|uniref:Lipoprotein n=1 Tax=Spirosoma endophyticum TaxID=662367 RepID=A0A1I2CBT3_9BACT|nr:hypothetical protein [Spirosoma endophyticum]SFE65799.1 hypothetical protein SAMN05216167_11735 [Spirosoma endophyticum]
MKLSKALLQTIAVAVAVTTLSSCDKGKVIDPKKDDTKQQIPYDCPGCGLG